MSVFKKQAGEFPAEALVEHDLNRPGRLIMHSDHGDENEENQAPADGSRRSSRKTHCSQGQGVPFASQISQGAAGRSSQLRTQISALQNHGPSVGDLSPPGTNTDPLSASPLDMPHRRRKQPIPARRVVGTPAPRSMRSGRRGDKEITYAEAETSMEEDNLCSESEDEQEACPTQGGTHGLQLESEEELAEDQRQTRARQQRKPQSRRRNGSVLASSPPLVDAGSRRTRANAPIVGRGASGKTEPSAGMRRTRSTAASGSEHGHSDSAGTGGDSETGTGEDSSDSEEDAGARRPEVQIKHESLELMEGRRLTRSANTSTKKAAPTAGLKRPLEGSRDRNPARTRDKGRRASLLARSTGREGSVRGVAESDGRRHKRSRQVNNLDEARETGVTSEQESEESDPEARREQVLSRLRDRSKLITMSEQQKRQQELEISQRERHRKRLRLMREQQPSRLAGPVVRGDTRATGLGAWHGVDEDMVHDPVGDQWGWLGAGAAQAPGAITAQPWHVGVGYMPGAAPTPGRGWEGGVGGGGSRAPWEGGPAMAGGTPMPGGGSWENGQGGPAMQGGKDKAGNAEITQVVVDPSVSFDQVGGLEHYVRALKEMVFLPLLYPELFERFKVQPPRGVLFYGPPGTGKTLVARALAAQASQAAGRKVSFFMRKGADVLSKWVGEAERQLRLLFEEATKAAPSIIFFDEIDGLAPVRSSKQDQIHNSIVSTLLALMDGLDSRGQVVVIGATNRIDSIDGALRRPGRFDRELLFPLPGLQARRSILDIHTRGWASPPPEGLKGELAALAVGYCGADLKALCTEASLHALRRRYPQIYEADAKLLIAPETVVVERLDWLAAAAAITPASHRSAMAHSRPLEPALLPALAAPLTTALALILASFPPAVACMQATADNTPGAPPSKATTGGGAAAVMRPRLLLAGPAGCGQAPISAALLHALEGLPVHGLGLPSLLADLSARSPEEALVHVIVEARRASPAILFLPHLQLWWETAGSTLRAVLLMLLDDLPPSLPLLLLATCDVPFEELDPGCAQLFRNSSCTVSLAPPCESQRRALLQGPVRKAAQVAPLPLLLDSALSSPHATPLPGGVRPVRLPVDPAAARERQKQEETCKRLQARVTYEAEQGVLRSLRMGLRDVTLRLLGDRRWKRFVEPVDIESDPVYWERVACPCDLATILHRVDARAYPTAGSYLVDMALIVQGWKQYHVDPQDLLEPVHAPEHQPQLQPATNTATVCTAGTAGAAGPHGNGRTSNPTITPSLAASGPCLATGIGEMGHGNLQVSAFAKTQQLGGSAAQRLSDSASQLASGGGLGQAELEQRGSKPLQLLQEPGKERPTAAKEAPAQALQHRDVGRAMALYDEACEWVRQRVPQDLMRQCEAIQARGGPAPPPAGLVPPEEIARRAMAEAAAAVAKERVAAAERERVAGASTGPGVGGGSRNTRQRGTGDVPNTLMHADPEELMRRTKQAQRKREREQQAQQAAQQAQHAQEEGTPVAVDVVEDEAAEGGHEQGVNQDGLMADGSALEVPAPPASSSAPPSPTPMHTLSPVGPAPGSPTTGPTDLAPPGSHTTHTTGIADTTRPAVLATDPGPRHQDPGAVGAGPGSEVVDTPRGVRSVRGSGQCEEAPLCSVAAKACEGVVGKLTAATEGWTLEAMEQLLAQVARAVAKQINVQDRLEAVRVLEEELTQLARAK